jgi:hypothetical protein
MNYYGAVTDESVTAGDVYRFLQKAMQNVTADRPFADQTSIAKEIFDITMKVKGTQTSSLE